MKKDDGLDDDDCDIRNILPANLRAYILSNTKRIINILISEINCFYNFSINYGDTGGLYSEKKCWDALNKANLVGENFGQSKNHYQSGGIFYGLFLDPTIKFFSTINEFGIIEEH